jgi:hypothetical protein
MKKSAAGGETEVAPKQTVGMERLLDALNGLA